MLWRDACVCLCVKKGQPCPSQQVSLSRASFLSIYLCLLSARHLPVFSLFTPSLTTHLFLFAVASFSFCLFFSCFLFFSLLSCGSPLSSVSISPWTGFGFFHPRRWAQVCWSCSVCVWLESRCVCQWMSLCVSVFNPLAHVAPSCSISENRIHHENITHTHTHTVVCCYYGDKMSFFLKEVTKHHVGASAECHWAAVPNVCSFR